MSADSWNPQQYDKFKAERSQPFYDLMALLQPIPQAKIVDLGCGTGELTAELHRKMQAKSTLGLDSSEGMLTKASAFKTLGLTFQKGDLQKWHVLGSKEDVIEWVKGTLLTSFQSRLSEPDYQNF